MPEVASVVLAIVINPAELTKAGVEEPTDSIAPGAVFPIPTFPLFPRYKTGRAASPASPLGDLWKLSVPLSRMLNVWAVAAPLRERLAERDAEPVISRAVKGVALLMPTLPAMNKLWPTFSTRL